MKSKKMQTTTIIQTLHTSIHSLTHPFVLSLQLLTPTAEKEDQLIKPLECMNSTSLTNRTIKTDFFLLPFIQ